jgi:serine/threonine protein kinase
MEIFTEAAHALEKASLSLASLHQLYQGVIPVQNWPGTIDITSLRLIKQLHDSVSVVRIAVTGEEVIFKSNTGDFNHLYHEMKTLLTISPHPNIISRPLRLITKRSSFGGKEGVIGFILPYYPLGSIRDILPLRLISSDPSNNASSTTFKQSLKWAHQITSALHHIHTSPASQTFYSDLRPDNILLSPSSDLILCDFEQRGNWHEWLPPEILYRQYIENLRSNLPSSDPDYVDRWTHLFSSSVSTSSVTNSNTSTNPLITSKPKTHKIDPFAAVLAANTQWFALSRPLQERAMVYTLGIFIYCLFEGLSNPRNNIANAFPFEGLNDVEFPEFRRTPVAIRRIIRRCTGEGMEWKQEPGRRVVRVGGRLLREGWEGEGDGDDGKDVDAARKVLDTGMQWWEGQLGKAEAFLEGEEWRSGKFGKERPTLRELLEMIEGVQSDADKFCNSNFGYE